jgi:ABC-type polysaccharide/polyol phosphate transport system ATPase subunit
MSASSTITRPTRGVAGGIPAVSVSDLSKAFKLPKQRYSTFKERVLHPFDFNAVSVLHALENVSFEVPVGEFFGIVGRNGSGKTTLLKCLAGIYSVDSGTVRVAGRVSPFLELGVGFNLELTARDNAIISAIMLGLSRREARWRFDEIIAFAELEDYLDLKVKNYSSGMLVRLAFSTAITVDADVLLIDEVLAVGDASFQQKCFDSFERLRRQGRTMLFVTHDMAAVRRVCDRAMLLEAGRLREIGDTDSVTRAYNEVNFARLAVPSADDADESRPGEAAVIDAWFEDGSGARIVACASGQPVAACMRVAFRAELHDPQFLLVVRNELGHPVLAAGSEQSFGVSGTFRSGETAVVRVRFENLLAPTRYGLTVVVTRDAGGADVLDHRPNAASLLVHSTYTSGAVVELPFEVEIERSETSAQIR